MKAIGLVIALTLVATLVRADVVGEARVVDGDTLKVGREHVRLHGIDAPETRQSCTVYGQVWRCGESAALALKHEATGRKLTCRGSQRDRYGRLIAVCYAGPLDLNAKMVREGWALAYRRYATDYVSEEDQARVAGKGIWRSQFDAPWKWRQTEKESRRD